MGGRWTYTALSVDKPVHADRPLTDGSTALAGGSWPTLKGAVQVSGVGVMSYHDREASQPLKAHDPAERNRPTYVADALSGDYYGNTFDKALGTGATVASDDSLGAARRTQSWQQHDAQFSRAPSYWNDNWPQGVTSSSSSDASRPFTDEWLYDSETGTVNPVANPSWT